MSLEYVAGNSHLHRLNIRVKWLIFVALLASAIFVTDPLFLMAESLILIFVALRAGIPWGRLWLILKSLSVLVIIMFVLNMIVWRPSPSETIVFYVIPPLKFLPQTIQGLAFSTAMLWKSVVLILALRIVTIVTPIEQMIEGLVAYKIPYRLAMAIGTGLQLAPAMFNMTVSLMEAQKSRAWEYDYNNPLKKARAFFAIMLPFIIIGRKMGEEVAVSLEVRGFGIRGINRTLRRVTRMTGFDWVVAALLILLTIAQLALGIYGNHMLTSGSTAALIKSLAGIR